MPPAIAPAAALTLADGTTILVPDSLGAMTSYVLLEQGDWFEDEVRFVRKFLAPGQNAIDIGASLGVYTLPIAKAVGSAGKVWAFEPSSQTAELLARSIAANRFAHVTLERSALSRAVGSARLSMKELPELNELVRGEPPPGDRVETVPVSSLDASIDRFGWTCIHFVKVDAEGEEANILDGGERFFREFSPLVQYEVKAGSNWNLQLPECFARHGYSSYRLVPGINALVRFDAAAPVDPYLLNLFACKEDLAGQLAARGLLVDGLEASGEGAPDTDGTAARAEECHRRSLHFLADAPYGSKLLSQWQKGEMTPDRCMVEHAIWLYSLRRSTDRPPRARYRALSASYDVLKGLSERSPSATRLASLARVAKELGMRRIAVEALGTAANIGVEQQRVDMSEPFLAPNVRFERLDTDGRLGMWFLAGVLEELELLAQHSSFFSGAAAAQRLQAIQSLGFEGEEMRRRRHLLKARASSGKVCTVAEFQRRTHKRFAQLKEGTGNLPRPVSPFGPMG